MQCANCGAFLDQDSTFCGNCGRQVFNPSPPGGLVSGAGQYAGFWIRVLAFFIDSLIVVGSGVVLGFALAMLLAVLGGLSDLNYVPEFVFIYLLCGVGSWLYYALMESSARQATLGKSVLGLRVTDLGGNRITFGRATGRYFGKILSGLIFDIGFIMVGITDRKQGLHDMIAGTLVLRD